MPVVDTLNDGFLSADVKVLVIFFGQNVLRCFFQLKIWRDCGRDDLCIPDLQLTSATV